MIRRPPRSTRVRSSAASDVYKRQEEACKITNQLIKEVESNGFTIKTIDVGGGIGIDENEKFKFIEYFDLINSYFAKKDRTIIFEPGRTIIGNTSILVSKILYIKETEDKIFVVIDAGMNDFMRPALYGATHDILPILQLSLIHI